ncbi:aspartate--ammonia ligase [Chitinophagaceae bacterium MMS25-I14]
MLATAPKIKSLQTEQQVHFVKKTFSSAITSALQLHPVFAPLFVSRSSGINDDLNGTETPIHFKIAQQEDTYAIVHSLAKWKRQRLAELEIPTYEGIITNMIALRPDEELSDIHSVMVDQWDWEMVIRKEDRTLDFLKKIVERIYRQIVFTESIVHDAYPHLPVTLPGDITFLHTEDLQQEYPGKTPKEREHLAAEKYGAIFLIGIGGDLKDGKPHDGRAPDYDDWSTPTTEGCRGLNGDIILWHPVMKKSLEISSMGIRVDEAALARQLVYRDATSRGQLPFHQSLLGGKLPQTIGGGIGQSRLAMFMLKEQHIGAVQSCVL